MKKSRFGKSLGRLAGAALLTAALPWAGTASADQLTANKVFSGTVNTYNTYPDQGLGVSIYKGVPTLDQLMSWAEAGDADKVFSYVNVELADNATLNVRTDFEINGGFVKLGDNSTLNTALLGGAASQPGFGVNIGDGSHSSYLFMGGDSTINAGSFITVKNGAVLLLEGNGTTANLNLADPKGIFLVGDASAAAKLSDFADFELPYSEGDPFEPVGDFSNGGPGGLFHLEPDAVANIKGRAVFGNGSTVKLLENSQVNITGNTYFLAGSTYEVNRTETATGKITVTGTATIDPNANLILTGSQVSNASNNVILTAGTLTGDFKNALYELTNDGTSLTVGAYKGSESVLDNAGVGGGNAADASSLINKILGGSSSASADLVAKLSTAVQQIAALNPAQAEKAAKQLIGEESLNAINAHQDTLAKVVSALNTRFQALHGNTAPSAGYGPADNRLWAGGFGQWIRQKNADDVFGYDYDAAGFILGYDREMAAVPGLTLGVSGSVSNGTLKNNDGLAQTDIQTTVLSLYGSYEFGGGFFLDGDLGYGHSRDDTDIDWFAGGSKSADYSSDSFMGGLNAGYGFHLTEAATLTPSAGIRYTRLKQDGYKEKPSDSNVVANWYGDRKQNFVEVPLNLKLATTFETSGGGTISPEVRVGGIIAANNSTSEQRVGFVGSNDSMLISGIKPGKSRMTAGAGLKAQLNDSLDVFVNYDLEGRNGYKAHSASFGVGISF